MSSVVKQLDVVEILKLLPHRYPFVMIDRIIDHVPGEQIKALKNVTINEPFFQGHFPVQPVMPGVLILEGLAQAGAVMAYLAVQENIGNKLIYFAGLDKVRFRQKVVPGDQLIMDITTIRCKMNLWSLAGKAFVDGKLVAEANLKATFG